MPSEQTTKLFRQKSTLSPHRHALIEVFLQLAWLLSAMEIPGKVSGNTITDDSFALKINNKESDFEFPVFPVDNALWSLETSTPDIHSRHEEQAHIPTSSTTEAVLSAEENFHRSICQLREHKATQSDERPHRCGLDPTELDTRENLAEQQRRHRKGKPYKCEVCGKGFRHTISLNVHKRLHTGEKPYKCEVCGEVFAQSGNLNIHKRVHTCEKPYKCEICGRGFSRKNRLIDHERIHTGEIPFECDTCGMRFRTRDRLTKHKKIHPDERPVMSARSLFNTPTF